MSLLSDGLIAAAKGAGLPFSIRTQGSLANVYFTDTLPVPSYAPRPDAALMTAFHRAALQAGVFISPRGMLCTATVLNEEIVEEAVERLSQAMTEIQKAM